MTANSSCRTRSPGGAVAQRLRGFESAEPEKTVKRSSRRTGVNLQFFPVGAYFLGIVKASSPFLTGCGTQHPHRALGGTCVLLAAAPTTAPCFCRWRRSQLLHCGVGGVQRQGGGSRNTPPCLWPSGASLPACTKQKLSPRSVHFSGSLLVSKENIPRQAETFRSTKKRAAAECSSPVKVCALIRSRMQCGGRAARHGCSGCP